MVGLNKYEDKERRKIRRKLHEERDLRGPKKPHRPKILEDDYEHWTSQDWIKHLDDEI